MEVGIWTREETRDWGTGFGAGCVCYTVSLGLLVVKKVGKKEAAAHGLDRGREFRPFGEVGWECEVCVTAGIGRVYRHGELIIDIYPIDQAWRSKARKINLLIERRK
jgi:hypothetical protein